MPDSAVETDINTILRDMAETQLKTGTAGIAGNYSLGEDALNLLHRLSSNPDSAGDALKLLHELQVHQVEIDLQNEVIQEDGHRLVNELAHYRQLYESAPFGYFVVNFEGAVLAVNRAGAELFGVATSRLSGTRMHRFLAPDSQAVLTAILGKLRDGDTGLLGELCTTNVGNNARPLRVRANLSPDKRCALLVCCEIP